jgi:hypothetical protein
MSEDYRERTEDKDKASEDVEGHQLGGQTSEKTSEAPDTDEPDVEGHQLTPQITPQTSEG